MEKLKECPFCGGDVELIDIDPNDHYFMIQCKNGQCCSATCFGEITKEEVIDHWDKRVSIENKGTMNIKM